MARTLNDRKRLIFLVVFVVYVFGRLGLSGSALSDPRELPDTTAYLRISRQPLSNQNFWASSRPFAFPLLLKIARQNLQVTAALQLTLSIISWGLLALLLSSFIQTPWLNSFSFLWILFLSLSPRIAGWDFIMLSESVSLSMFALFLSCGLLLLKAWNWARLLSLCVVAFLFSFSRDTNAYLLLMVGLLLLTALLLRWVDKRVLILIFVFLGVFALNNATADLGKRWVFPLINVIGRRILPEQTKLEYLRLSCDMPVSPALMAMTNKFANAQERAFYLDPQLEDFRIWLTTDGKNCYVRLLLSDPVASIVEPLKELNGLILFHNLRNLFSDRYDPLIPFTFERFLYPVHQALSAWVLVSLVALVAIFRQLWKSNSLWSAFLLLTLTIFPHLFITWHGDAMAPERHAVSVGLQLVLAAFIMVILILDMAGSWPKRSWKASFQSQD